MTDAIRAERVDLGAERNGGGVVIDLRDGRPLIDGVAVEQRPVSFVDLGAEYQALKEEIDAAMAEVIRRGDFVLGSAVSAFEESFARYCGVSHAVGVDSGWSALELALRAFGIGPGDEVITAANTFMATAGAIESAGARPVLVDCSAESHNLDPELIERAITSRTKAIVPVHLYGRPADMDPIAAIAQRHGLVVVEDACQAHGATYMGRRAGSLGHAAAFSFYPAKNLGAFGDGGMVVTDDPDAAGRLRLLRNLGSPEKYQHIVRGFNHRLDTLQAAVLAVKLAVLDERNTHRRRVAEVYAEMLGGLPVTVPTVPAGVESVYHLYVVRSEDRNELQQYLAAHEIGTGIHYPIPIHLQQAFAHLGHGRGDFPVTERLAGEILSLPMHPNLTVEDVARVGGSVRSFFDEAGGITWN